MPFIAFTNVTAGYLKSGPSVLSNFNLKVEKGSLTVLLGGSGSGKTTVFRLLYGELQPTEGDVVVGDSRMGANSATAIARIRRSLGIVSSSVQLLEDRSVEENLLLPLEVEGMTRERRTSRLESVLTRFNLQDVQASRPTSLSMSERQRAAIAIAVIKEPLVLLADEPTAHLDRSASNEIAQLLAQENLRGMTILVGTSDERFVSSLPQARVVHL